MQLTNEDTRPIFSLAASGHPKLIPGGLWTCNPDPHAALSIPGVAAVWRSLDSVLTKRIGSHRVTIYGRGNNGQTVGIDAAIRCFAESRKLGYLPLVQMADVWPERVLFRRDLEMVGRSHAVIWFGEQEEKDDGPAMLAQVLAIPLRIVRELG